MSNILAGTAIDNFVAYFTTDVCLDEFIYLFRIFIAGILGFLIGIERLIHAKEQGGARTYIVVALGSALMMVVSMFGFGSADIDASRVAASIVSGIGFLGAGIIIYKREKIHGIRSAAAIWATAGVGMAIGGGLYITGVVTAVLIVLAQSLLIKNKKIHNFNYYRMLAIEFKYSDETIEYIKEKFNIEEFKRFKATEHNVGLDAQAVIRVSRKFDVTELAKIIMDNPDIISIERLNDD